MNLNDILHERSTKINAKICKVPFSKGAERLAYYAYDEDT
jgi:hypothetical protein